MPVGDGDSSVGSVGGRAVDGRSVGDEAVGVAEVRALVGSARAVIGGFDPALVEARDAAELVSLFATIEKLGAAGKALAADRVAGTDLWRRLGHPSAAAWLASLDGTGVGEAVGVLQTAEAMGGLDATVETFKAGKLSRRQAKAVATAAKADPTREQELLLRADTQPVTDLEAKAREIRQTASGETVEERHARAHRDRRIAVWQDDDGGHGRWDLPLAEHARLVAELEARAKQAFRGARAEGRREPHHAYLADALLSLLDTAEDAGGAGRRSASDVKVIVKVDDSALQRGHALEGELCEIAGVGPVPVAVVREWVEGDAFKAAIVADGVDIRAVAHLGRKATALQRTALDWISVTCTVEGCGRTARLEIDHSEEWATTLRTVLEHLDRLCGHHHDLKTHDGWILGPRRPDGTRTLTPPPATAPERGGTAEAPAARSPGCPPPDEPDDPDDGPRPLGLFDTG